VVVTNIFGATTSAVATVTIVFNIQCSASPTSGPVALNVQFSCPSADSGGNPITSWSWNFGDGSSSTLQNPTHLYTAVGNFRPSLLATISSRAIPPTVTRHWVCNLPLPEPTAAAI
jgi:PKD repeat protein